jgi:hypothetical protein
MNKAQVEGRPAISRDPHLSGRNELFSSTIIYSFSCIPQMPIGLQETTGHMFSDRTYV